MAKNLRALTDEELDFIDSNYKFETLEGTDGKKYIIVSFNGYDRRVLHDFDKPFLINTSVRKVNISTDAINYWYDVFKDKYSLIEVQNAINVLIVLYQPVNEEEILKQLERRTSKVTTV